jgi:hypothetical protein
MLTIILALLITHLVQRTQAHAGPQFCVQDDVFGLDVCLVASSQHWRNSSIHVLFSGRFDRGTGWAAFGPGTKMNDANMFVVYPSTSAEGA